MKDPRRLIHGATDPRIVELLRAGADEQPSQRALQRTLHAAALGGTIAASSFAAAASSAEMGAGLAGGAAGSSGVASSVSFTSGIQVSLAAQVAGGQGLATAGVAGGSLAAKIGTTVGVLKWVGVGALGAASVTYAPELADWVSTTPAPISEHRSVTFSQNLEQQKAAAVVHPKPEQVAREVPLAPETPAVASPRAAAQQPTNPSENRLRAGSVAAVAPPAAREPQAGASDFSAEVQAVELGRRAIRDGDHARSLRLLSAYETQYPRLQLQPEVWLLQSVD